jgi:diacylglycerol O-acyltransferase
MQQLSGLDALFLYLEQANITMNIGPVMIYSPAPGSSAGSTFRSTKNSFQRGLNLSGIFRRKLATVPLDLDRPYWIEDAEFDLDDHLSHSHLPSPGNWSQLCSEVSTLHAQPLDRRRPLWMAHVIEGLDALDGIARGSFAIYLKTHHATQDGATGVEMVQAIHDQSAAAARGSSRDNWQSENKPAIPGMMVRAMINNIRKPIAMARVASRVIPAVRTISDGADNNSLPLLLKERTRFNARISARRVVGFARFDLTDLQAVRPAVANATLNDVCATIISGALFQYLHSKGEQPEHSLIAGAPVNARRDEQVGTGGNVISGIRFSLHTGCKPPLQRLAAICRDTVAAKRTHDELGGGLMGDLAESLPAYLSAWTSKAVMKSNMMARIKPAVHTLITNVPGPREPLYLEGAEMQMIIGLGPCVDGIGLFHTISSYCQIICIGFQACPDMLPDPEFYSHCLQDSFRELASAANLQNKKPARKRKPRVRA